MGVPTVPIGGALHVRGWYLDVIAMVPYDMVGGTLNYGAIPYMLVGGIWGFLTLASTNVKERMMGTIW